MVAVVDSSAEHGVEVPVHPFHLSISFWVVACGVGDLDVQGFSDLEEDAAHELLAAVGVDAFRDSVPGEDFLFQDAHGGHGGGFG